MTHCGFLFIGGSFQHHQVCYFSFTFCFFLSFSTLSVDRCKIVEIWQRFLVRARHTSNNQTLKNKLQLLGSCLFVVLFHQICNESLGGSKKKGSLNTKRKWLFALENGRQSFEQWRSASSNRSNSVVQFTLKNDMTNVRRTFFLMLCVCARHSNG